MGRGATLKRHDDRGGTPWPEKVLTFVSVAVTVGLVAYVSWQAYATPLEARPEVRVSGVEETANGQRLVHVEFDNRGGVGLLSATVEVDCAKPPPSVTFTNVPAEATRAATVTCPDTPTLPPARLTAWVEA